MSSQRSKMSLSSPILINILRVFIKVYPPGSNGFIFLKLQFATQTVSHPYRKNKIIDILDTFSKAGR